MSYGRGTCGGVECVLKYFWVRDTSINDNGKIHFSFPNTLKFNTLLFEEGNQYSQYLNLLLNIIEWYEVDLNIVGINPGDLGNDSFKTYVETIV